MENKAKSFFEEYKRAVARAKKDYVPDDLDKVEELLGVEPKVFTGHDFGMRGVSSQAHVIMSDKFDFKYLEERVMASIGVSTAETTDLEKIEKLLGVEPEPYRYRYQSDMIKLQRFPAFTAKHRRQLEKQKSECVMCSYEIKKQFVIATEVKKD